jgi:hypothetical protein
MFNGETDSIPASQLKRTMALRAYDADHMMAAIELVEGERLDEVAREMLKDDEVKYVLVYNAKPGCFAFGVERA